MDNELATAVRMFDEVVAANNGRYMAGTGNIVGFLGQLREGGWRAVNSENSTVYVHPTASLAFKTQLDWHHHRFYNAYIAGIVERQCSAETHPNLPVIYRHCQGLTLMEKLETCFASEWCSEAGMVFRMIMNGSELPDRNDELNREAYYGFEGVDGFIRSITVLRELQVANAFAGHVLLSLIPRQILRRGDDGPFVLADPVH
jgi:hypothetical protein